MLEEILKETASADNQAQDAEADSLEASQEWDPPALGETTTRDYQVQVYLKPVSSDDETMIICLSTIYFTSSIYTLMLSSAKFQILVF